MHPRFLCGVRVANLFIFLCCPIMCLYVLYFRVVMSVTIFGSSLPPVVCRRAHVLDRGLMLTRKLLNQGFLLAKWLSWSHHFESFTVATTMIWLTLEEHLCHKWSRICSTCRKHFPVLSSFITYHTRSTPRAQLMEQELPTLPDHMSSPQFVLLDLLFYVQCFEDRCLSFFF